MINGIMTAVAGAPAARPDLHRASAGWAEAGFAAADVRPGEAGPGDGADQLSAEARLMVAALGLPIAAPAHVGNDRAVLRQYVRALNDLIVGPADTSPTLALLRGDVPAKELAQLADGDLRLRMAPLWDVGELAAMERLPLPELEAEWRRRAAERVPEAAAVVRDDLRCAEFWKDMPGGDFDLEGRGRDYTEGMSAYPACRAVGVESLVALLGAFKPGPRVYLDVLGGEGYVWRLMEAKRQLAQRQVVQVPPGAFGGGGSVPAPLAELLARTALADPEAVVLAVEPDGTGRVVTGRLVGLDGGRVVVSRPLPLTGNDVVDWLQRFPSPDATGPLGAMARARGRQPVPVMITNDVSRHMFFRAGLWGMPTREDAMRMSRTFRPDSLDGVLAAYGTHHIPDIYAAIRESHTLLKPGGVVVVHDFFDRGPVGSWFHDVVDPYSKTGHDMPHLGPVEMAVDLFRAGFRSVELMEIEDPFIFTAEPGDPHSAREIALRYTMGMYGMTHNFADRLDDLEALVRDVLTYPELGQTAVFEQDFALIPRRAIVARARKPAPGAADRFSESDAALVRALEEGLRASPESLERRSGAPAEATRSWFGKDGERWGLSARAQREFMDWAGAQRESGALS